MITSQTQLRKMSIGDVLDYTIEVYKINFKKLTLLALIFYIPFTTIYTFVAAYFSSDLMSIGSLMNNFEAMENTGDYFYKIIAFYVAMLVLGFLYFIYSFTLQAVLDSAITKQVYDFVVNKKSHDVKVLVKTGFSKFGSLAVNRLLYTLILGGIGTAAVFALYIGIIIDVLAAIGILGTSGNSPSFWQIVGIIVISLITLAALIALLLVAAFIGLRFIFGTQVVTIEGKSAAGALSRSGELIGKNFWHVFFTYILGWALLLLLPQLLASGAFFLAVIDRTLFVLATTVIQLISAVLYPFMTTLLTMLFISLKIRKEGLDLEVKVDNLLEEQKRQGENIVIE